MNDGYVDVTGATQIGGVVGASEHDDGSTVTARSASVTASVSAKANTEPSSPGCTQTAAAGVSSSISQSS